MENNFGNTPLGVWLFCLLPAILGNLVAIAWLCHQYLRVPPHHAGTWEEPLEGEVLETETAEEDDYGHD